MAILMSLVIFVAVLLVTAFIGMRLWVRPKVAIERVTGSGVGTHVLKFRITRV
jgi:hypothetical protein